MCLIKNYGRMLMEKFQKQEGKRMLKTTMPLLALAVLGLGSGCASHENHASGCEGGNSGACFNAADQVWHLRASKLKACEGNEILCIQSGESREQAMTRLRTKSVEQNAVACDRGNHAEACVRAGSGLVILGINMPQGQYKKLAERAELFFDKGCILGSRQGCTLKGSTHRAGK